MEPPFPNVLKRSFLRAASLAHRQYVLQHRNGVCVLGLAPDHPILNGVPGETVKVVFPANMAVQRKRKRGKNSGSLRAWDTICSVHAGDTVYNIPACVGGQVLELNYRLESSPELLVARVSLTGSAVSPWLTNALCAASRRGLHCNGSACRRNLSGQSWGIC